MAVRLKSGKYMCGYCKKEYKHPLEADDCKDSHDLIYLTISRTDLGRLLQYIYTQENKLLNERILDTLREGLKKEKIVDGYSRREGSS